MELVNLGVICSQTSLKHSGSRWNLVQHTWTCKTSALIHGKLVEVEHGEANFEPYYLDSVKINEV